MDAFRPSIRLLAAGVHSIDLERGTTLKLEHGAGATMHLATAARGYPPATRLACAQARPSQSVTAALH